MYFLSQVWIKANYALYSTFSLPIPEKAMAPHSSTLAWKIPWAEKPGRLQSIGSRRVGHNWETSLSLFTFMHWKRKWQPTPVFLPGESQGRGSLMRCSLWVAQSQRRLKLLSSSSSLPNSWLHVRFLSNNNIGERYVELLYCPQMYKA